MKKIMLTFLAAAIMLAGVAQCACAQKARNYSKFGITFTYPEGCRVSEEVSYGHYERVHCTSEFGNFFSITLFKDRTTPEILSDAYKAEFEEQFKAKGAKGIAFTEIEETILSKRVKGFLMTFTLDGMPFETRNFCFLHNGQPLSVTRQYFTFNRKKSEKFYDVILSSLMVK